MLSNNFNYNQKYINIDNSNNLNILNNDFNNIVANDGNSQSIIFDYIINNNTLYSRNNNKWIIAASGYYYISSDNANYTEKYIYVDNLNNLNILNDSFTSIIVKNDDSQSIVPDYIINNNKLYQRTNNTWTLVKNGYYYILSNNINYAEKYININNLSNLSIINSTFTTITANNGNSSDIIPDYIIDNNQLYSRINNSWIAINSGYYLITSNNSDYSQQYIAISNLNLNIINSSVFTDITANNGNIQITIPNYIIDNNKLYTRNEDTNSWILTPSGGYYYLTSDNITYSQKYIYIDSLQNLNLINLTSITADYGSLADIPNYIIDNNKLYSQNNNIWTLIVKGYYYISSNNPIYSQKFIFIDEELNYLSIINDTFTAITANNGFANSIIPDYIIDSNKLYLRNNNSWMLVNNGYYLITSNNTTYSQKYVTISNLNLNIVNNAFTDIIANNGNSQSTIPNYIINNNKLYARNETTNLWVLVSTGEYYYLTSDNINYSQKYVKIDSSQNLSLLNLNSITANNGNPTSVIADYIIDNNQLYSLNNNGWIIIRTGYYYIMSSDNSNYAQKYIYLDDLNYINIINSPFTVITANNETSSTGVPKYIIDGSKLYSRNEDTNNWIIVNNGYYLITSDNATYSQKYVTITNSNLSIINSSFIDITANNGSALSTVNSFIIDNNKLYSRNEDTSTWILAASDYYYLTSDNAIYTDKYIKIDNSQNLILLTYYAITANNHDSSSIIPDYIIDNNQLYSLNNSNWIITRNNYYFIISSDNSKYSQHYIYVDNSNNLNIFTNITANNGDSTSTSDIVIGDYIIDNDRLFIGTANLWLLITDGYYHISSNNTTYNNKFIYYNDLDILTVLNKTTDDFTKIIANNGNSQISINDYIIDNNQLYIRSNNSWTLVTNNNNYYFITSDNTIYNQKNVYINASNNLDLFSTNITANNGNSQITVPNYIIDNQKLYKRNLSNWVAATSGYYNILSSDNTSYNQKQIYVDSSNNLSIFSNIIANNGKSQVVFPNYIIDNNKLYKQNGNNWILVTSGYYYVTSDNITYNQKYAGLDNSNNLSVFTNITADNGNSQQTIDNYIISNNQLYTNINNSWTLVTNNTNYYFITSDNITYNQKYIYINTTNKIAFFTTNITANNGNSQIAVPSYIIDNNKLYKRNSSIWEPATNGYYNILSSDNTIYNQKQIYVDNSNNLSIFNNIIADNGNSQITVPSYIIDDNKLYIRNNNSWLLVSSGYYYITSDNITYNQKNVAFDSFNNLSVFINIMADNGIAQLTFANYIIDNNKLYSRNNNIWSLVTNGYYFITSNNVSYNQIGVYIDNTNNLSFFSNITANNGSSQSIIPNYIIDNGKLYVINNNSWSLVTNGYYTITSDNINYNQKFISFDTLNNISIFNNITANNGNSQLEIPNYIIDNSKLYMRNNNIWLLVTSGYYYILSDNNNYNQKKVSFDTSNNLSVFINITANNGNSQITITDYIIDSNKLYSRNNNIWTLVTSGYYYISSADSIDYNYKYINIDTTNNIFIFNSIIANSGNNLDVIPDYILDNDKLYLRVNNIWFQVISGFYLVTSNNDNYNQKYISFDNLNNLLVFINITANDGNPLFAIPNYIIDNNKLYSRNNNIWEEVTTGHYFISSDNPNYEQKYINIIDSNLNIYADSQYKWSYYYFNNKIIKIEYDNHISDIIEITANISSIVDTNADDIYTIVANKLYKGNQLITDGEYLIKCDNILYNNKCIKASPDGSLMTINIKNITLYNHTPSFIITNNEMQSYYKNHELSRQMNNIPANNYIILIDLLTEPNNHFILQKKDITTLKIPKASYHCWSLNKDYLNLICYQNNININIDANGNVENIQDIPINSYYQIEYDNKKCIYYYSSGSNIKVNEIPYYTIRNAYNINKIYMIDNKLFNIEMKQLVSISKDLKLSENFVDTKLNITNFSIDSINNLSYQSLFIKKDYEIKNYNEKYIELLGDNETLVNMILRVNYTNDTIYQPMIIKKDKKINVPNIIFNYYFNDIEYKYAKSFVVINTSNLTSTILTNDILVGYINNLETTDTYTTLSPNLEIINKKILIKKNFDVGSLENGLHLWKVSAKKNDIEYNFYFWTLFTNNDNLAKRYLSLNDSQKLNTSYPYSKNININNEKIIVIDSNKLLELQNEYIIAQLDISDTNYNYLSENNYLIIDNDGFMKLSKDFTFESLTYSVDIWYVNKINTLDCNNNKKLWFCTLTTNDNNLIMKYKQSLNNYINIKFKYKNNEYEDNIVPIFKFNVKYNGNTTILAENYIVGSLKKPEFIVSNTLISSKFISVTNNIIIDENNNIIITAGFDTKSPKSSLHILEVLYSITYINSNNETITNNTIYYFKILFTNDILLFINYYKQLPNLLKIENDNLFAITYDSIIYYPKTFYEEYKTNLLINNLINIDFIYNKVNYSHYVVPISKKYISNNFLIINLTIGFMNFTDNDFVYNDNNNLVYNYSTNLNISKNIITINKYTNLTELNTWEIKITNTQKNKTQIVYFQTILVDEILPITNINNISFDITSQLLINFTYNNYNYNNYIIPISSKYITNNVINEDFIVGTISKTNIYESLNSNYLELYDNETNYTIIIKQNTPISELYSWEVKFKNSYNMDNVNYEFKLLYFQTIIVNDQSLNISDNINTNIIKTIDLNNILETDLLIGTANFSIYKYISFYTEETMQKTLQWLQNMKYPK